MRFFSDERLIFALIGLIWIELSLLPLFSIQQIKPDFFFIFLVFYAFRINWKRVVTLAFLVGLTQDIFTNSFFGLETVSYVCGAILLRFLLSRLDREKRWIQLASLFCFSCFTLIVTLLTAFLMEEHYRINDWTLMRTLLSSLYTTVMGALLFPLLERWLKPPLREKQYELF